jgi:hypothetical protein
MKKLITISIATAIIGINHKANAQLVIQDDSTFKTKNQMLLANELFESGEPFAEALGYNLDLLDPTVLNSPDSASYTYGIENYEYSRYLLGTLTGRSGMGLNMMWSPIITANAAMMPASFDGMYTGGMANGYKEDDMLMMMMQNFGMNANQTPPMNAFPQFADFIEGNNNLPQTVASNFSMDWSTLRWDRTKMIKTLNLGAMGQSAWKQYFWAQDMLGAFHDGNDIGIDADGTNSPDSINSPNFDPNNNIYYGGNNLDGFIGQVLTAVAINKTSFLINNMAYDGSTLGMVDPMTYDPANGIQYFPAQIAVTESTVLAGLPPKASALTVTDANSDLFDQISFLLATVSFKNMMEPTNTDADHYAYKEVFDGYPFPSAMGVNGSTVPGPYDLMKGASKIIFLNIMAMHYNSTEGTFVDNSSLDGSGNPIMGNTISAENATYILLALSKVSQEFNGTPLQTMADNAITSQINYILANLKDSNGGFYNSYTIGTGADNSPKTLGANAALIRGMYTAYNITNNTTYLTEANNAYNFLINNFYSPTEHVFRTDLGSNSAVYTPWNMALLSAALREASLVGNQTDASPIYYRVFKNVYNKMILCEAEASGETGGDSDGDGISFIAGSQKPFVFAEKGEYQMVLGVNELKNALVNVNIYPNPTSEFVNVNLDLKQDAFVNISIYNINGQLVLTHTNTNLTQGNHLININIDNLSSGNYIVKTSINNEPADMNKLVIE